MGTLPRERGGRLLELARADRAYLVRETVQSRVGERNGRLTLRLDHMRCGSRYSGIWQQKLTHSLLRYQYLCLLYQYVGVDPGAVVFISMISRTDVP